MRPVLEHLVPAVGQLVQRRARIRPEPAEGGQVVRPGQHVHRVDLHDGQPLDHPAQLPDADGAGGPRVGEPLRGQGDAPGQPGRQPLDAGGLTAADPAWRVRRRAPGACPRLRCPGGPRGSPFPRAATGTGRTSRSVRPGRRRRGASRGCRWSPGAPRTAPAAARASWTPGTRRGRGVLAGGGRVPPDAGPRRAGGRWSGDAVVGFAAYGPAGAGRRRAPDPAGPDAELSRCWWSRGGDGAGTAAGCSPPWPTSPGPAARPGCRCGCRRRTRSRPASTSRPAGRRTAGRARWTPGGDPLRELRWHTLLGEDVDAEDR